MKKIIIVNNNMKVGGVQKSLYNLLWAIEGKYDITLCLFKKIGVYAEQLPPSVRIIEAKGPYSYLGMSQHECKGFDFLCRGVLVLLCRIFGRTKLLKLFKCRLPELEGQYDCAIAFLHNGRPKSFYGGVQDFVLRCTNSVKKVLFLHGDYCNCGSNHAENNRQIEQFDQIAACSEGCRAALVKKLPHLANRCVTVRNCHRFEEIRRLANCESVVYDENYVNIVLVARLSREKGIDRAIEALAYAQKLGAHAMLHIVGDGGEREMLQALTQKKNLDNYVIFYGEQSNPYRYMKHADLLLMTSYHEAAPMVIDEARSLGLPILTTRTTSAHEMVEEAGAGWVCDNTQEALNAALHEVLQDIGVLCQKRIALQGACTDNRSALGQFDNLL